MLDVVGSIYEMLGRYTQPQISGPQSAAKEHVERIFHVSNTILIFIVISVTLNIYAFIYILFYFLITVNGHQ